MDRYQTGWPRFVAFWIDAFVLSALRGAISWLISLNMGMIVSVLLAIAYSSVHVAYPVYMHGRFGQTLGKVVVRVRVVGIDGFRISYEQAALRDVVPCLLLPVSIWLALHTVITGEQPHPTTYQWAYSFAFMWVLLEMLTMLFNEQRRAIHDLIARTVVVRLP